MLIEGRLRQASYFKKLSTTWLVRLGFGAVALRAGLRLAVMAMLLAARPAFAADPQGVFIYAISRNGTPVGQQRLEFVGDQGKLRVLCHTDLDVKVMGLSLYGFDQQVEEVRQNGLVLSLISEADDDGKDKKVTLSLNGDRLQGDYNGSNRDLDPHLATTLFWQKPAVGASQVIDPLRAKLRDINVTDLGPQTLDLPIGRTQAHHYKVAGEISRELWYDANGILVAGQLRAKDGSVLRQELQQRP
jgi:hypothetical protein